MVHLDLFSGMGGFSKGLLSAGMPIQKTYYSEVDKHAIAVYKHRFPDAEHVGSITNIRGNDLQHPNIITFGSPCQDFSVAGAGAGLGGSKSSLIKEAIRLISETRPDVFIWENVSGAFSSNSGADFWAIIQAFTNIGQYRLEWQLLNTSWILPQNRERIYLVGHLAGRSRSVVFPFSESDFEDYEKGLDSQSIQVLAKNKSQSDRVYLTKGIAPTLRRGTDSTGGVAPIIQLSGNPPSYRYLTEIEFERLQGFPDNWTQFGIYDGHTKIVSKTHRYRMCGNAVTVGIVKLIGGRLINPFLFTP